MRPDNRTIAILTVIVMAGALLLILMGAAFAEAWLYSHGGVRA